MAIAIGTRIGSYEITGHLGAGGMGEVFRARDNRIGRDVAIKVLPSEVAGNADRLRRFEQEARTAGALNHPNLVTIHDMGVHEGTPYLVMELLEGETLRAKLGDTTTSSAARIPIRKSMEYAQQLASGLAAAHEKGIVHRDLKPDNVVITRDGRLKILDFGLAKLTDRNGRSEVSATEERHTSPGTVLGTAGYMSPEQVRGYDTDHRTDIFSCGVILYEMLSGRRAFKGDSAADTMSAILHEDPPDLSTTSGQHVPPAVDRVIRRCLEKEKGERFESARDLAFALDAVTTSSTSSERIATAPAARLPKTNLVVTMGLVLAAAAIASLVTWRLMRAPAEPPQTSRKFTQLTFDAGRERSPSISPDGKTFVFVKGMTPHRMIYMQRVDGRTAIALSKSPDDDDQAPAFSPDGAQIAFRSERDGGGIFVMGATGESVRRLTSTGGDPAWWPDGSKIVFSSEDIEEPASRNSVASLWVVDLETGAVRKLFEGRDAVQPAVSPHARRIAYWGLPPKGGQRDLYTVAANGDPKSVVALTNDAELDWNPIWAPDGKSIFFSSDRGGTMNLWRIAVDEETGKPLGAPEPLSVPSTSTGSLSVSRDGHVVYVSRMRTEALRRSTFDPATGKLTTDAQPVMAGSLLVRNLSLSPDAQRIAFTTEAKQEDLYVMRTDGTDLRQLTNDVHRDRGPSWSPDGTRIFFYSARTGEYDTWSIRTDGSALTHVTDFGMINFPIVAPDGKHLTYFDITRQRISPMQGDRATAGEPLPPFPQASDAFYGLAWSPDGTRIAGTEWFLRKSIWIYTLATKTYRRVSIGTVVAWIDEHQILAAEDGKLILTNTESGESKVVADLPSPVIAIAHGGKVILTGGVDIETDIWQMTIEPPR